MENKQTNNNNNNKKKTTTNDILKQPLEINSLWSLVCRYPGKEDKERKAKT